MKTLNLVALLVGMLISFSAVRANDIGNYSFYKNAIYDQTSAAAPFLDPAQPYQLGVFINQGSAALFLTNSSLTTPSSNKLQFNLDVTNASGMGLEEAFYSKSALDTAIGSGTYNLSVLTTTPNQYSTQLVVGSDAYPPIHSDHPA